MKMTSSPSSGRRRPAPSPTACGLRPGALRAAAWLCLVTQGLFPVAVSGATVAQGISPVSTVYSTDSTPLTDVRTRVYQLGPLETAGSVAARHGLSVEELRRLNALRTFARGFDGLRQGDEVDVPAQPLTAAARGPLPAQPGREEETPARMAGLASQAGGLLAQGMNGDLAQAMARSYATGAASSALGDWLGRYGTARVTLESDEGFSLKHSQLELLLPWYETAAGLLFTQHAVHRTDERTQLNTGTGWRHFDDGYMTGVNLFFDHDLTRHHSRAGVGAEYWRDWLKLSGNGYLRLSNWRSAPELSHDYEARPANGWDLRMEGWLPAWPQFGGKVVYEQYYGDEVALFGRDARQKDPHALTAGLSWTPVPLVSLSAEQRQGKQGENDTRFGMSLNWQPGVSLERQLDPEAVGARRSLAGSRHDLVERNNNIVLEYRKKALVKLRLTDPVRGKPGEEKALVASLQSKYALKEMSVEAGTLTAAGGSVRSEGGQVTVTLPAYRYQATAESGNSYRVAVVATDVKGNHSEREESTVVVDAPQVDPGRSSLAATPGMLAADGVSTAQVTYLAQDVQGSPVAGLPVTLAVSGEAAQGVTLSAVKEDKPGEYTATLTAGTQTGTVTLTARVNGEPGVQEGTTVTLVTAAADAAHSTVTLETADVRAGAGKSWRAGDRVRVAVTLRDTQDRPVTGMDSAVLAKSVTVPGMGEPEAWQAQGEGRYTATHTAHVAGQDLRASLQLAGWSDSVKSDPYTIAAGEVDPAASTLTADPVSIVADGTDISTLVLALKDTHGNPVVLSDGVTVAQTGTPLANLTVEPTDYAKNSDGEYSMKVHGTTAGQATLQASAGGTVVTQTVSVALMSAPAEAAHSSISLETVNRVRAEKTWFVGEQVQVVVTLKDAQDRPVTDMDTAVLAQSVTVPGMTAPEIWQAQGGGRYTATHTAHVAGEGLQATLQLAGWSEPVKSDSYAVAVPKITGILVNDHTFAPDAGFPTTGFVGARFQLQINGTTPSAEDWTFSASAGWVSVSDSGLVTFNSKGTSAPVTITAAQNGTPVRLAYEIHLQKWFINTGETKMSSVDGASYCTQAGTALPSMGALVSFGSRQTGSLAGEWGRLSGYDGSGYQPGQYWTSSHYMPTDPEPNMTVNLDLNRNDTGMYPSHFSTPNGITCESIL